MMRPYALWLLVVLSLTGLCYWRPIPKVAIAKDVNDATSTYRSWSLEHPFLSGCIDGFTGGQVQVLGFARDVRQAHSADPYAMSRMQLDYLRRGEAGINRAGFVVGSFGTGVLMFAFMHLAFVCWIRRPRKGHAL